MGDLKELGIAIKAYRVAANETINDVSEAIEVDKATIGKVEAGLQRPSIELIELLARHFTLREQEVKRLWKLAGHEQDDFAINLDPHDIDLSKLEKDFEVMFAPVFYTDMVNVVSNQYGITINFIQGNGGQEKPVVVSRVGMSHKHAESIIKVLQESLRRANKHEEKQQNLPEEGKKPDAEPTN